jgi:hypothetical protein
MIAMIIFGKGYRLRIPLLQFSLVVLSFALLQFRAKDMRTSTAARYMLRHETEREVPTFFGDVNDWVTYAQLKFTGKVWVFR